MVREAIGSDKVYTSGTRRSVAPAATLERLRPHLARMGITRIGNVTGLDRIGIPTVMVCRPNARSIAVSQGKGADLDAAKASGVMEASELWHAENVKLPLRLASCSELRAEADTVDLGRPLPAGSRPFHEDLPILWVEGENLVSRRPRWVPFEVVGADYTLPSPIGSGCFQATTNGLASGNTWHEAVLHALCEVIERDATARWRAGGGPRAGGRLDLATVDDPLCASLIRRIDAAGLGLAVWDVTSEVAVPTFECVIVDRGEGADPESGAGCHPAPEVALARALTEAAQARLTWIAGVRDDLAPAFFRARARRQRAAVAREWLVPRGPLAAFGGRGGCETFSSAGDVAEVMARLERAGFPEAVVVDLSRAEIGIAVVRVVVPGLLGPLHGADGRA